MKLIPHTHTLPLSGGPLRKSLGKYACKYSDFSQARKLPELTTSSFVVAIENTDHERGLKVSLKHLT